MVDKITTNKDAFDYAGIENDKYDVVDPDVENLDQYTAVAEGPDGVMYGINETVQTDQVARLQEYGLDVQVPGENGSLTGVRASAEQIDREVAHRGGNVTVDSSGSVQGRDESFSGEFLDQGDPKERAMEGFVRRALGE